MESIAAVLHGIRYSGVASNIFQRCCMEHVVLALHALYCIAAARDILVALLHVAFCSSAECNMSQRCCTMEQRYRIEYHYILLWFSTVLFHNEPQTSIRFWTSQQQLHTIKTLRLG
jgi:hypothetical protein